MWGSWGAAVGVGRYDESTAWLVSFLNVGQEIASPFHNHLIFGANCSETHHVVREYAKHVAKQVETIEKKEYKVCDRNVKFQFELVPCDMKFLAFLNGELSNSAIYFSSFGNASGDSKDNINGSFGFEKEDTWSPWGYEKRIKDLSILQDIDS